MFLNIKEHSCIGMFCNVCCHVKCSCHCCKHNQYSFVKVLCDLIINRPCNIVSETKKFTLKNKLFVIIFNCSFVFVMFNIVSGDQEFSQIVCDF